MDIKKVSKEELAIINMAAEDFEKYKQTHIRCPRCGGELEMIDFGSAYRIKCRKEGCITVTFRGI